MQYTNHYQSPLGGILLAGDETGLTGLWFDGEKYFADHLDPKHVEKDLPLFRETKRWLDMTGSPFQLAVWEILRKIPYGSTTTYGEIARMIAAQKGLHRMSAQAVGGAVGHNEISIIVPCHRVVGTNGSLTGYAGGISKKAKLLALEKADMRHFHIPEKGTAL